MAFVQEVNAMTGNQPLREISERLYIQVARVVLKMMPELGLAAEFRAFRREMEEVLAAAEIGDWDAIGHIRRAHISMSFTRMLQNARARGAIPRKPRAEPRAPLHRRRVRRPPRPHPRGDGGEGHRAPDRQRPLEHGLADRL